MKTGGGTLVRLTLSGGALVASTAAACCFLSVWSYWYYELDADCVQARDCKCLLFGTSFAGGGFVGGDRFACQYVAYSLLASAGLAAYTSVYYGCRLLLCAGHSRGRHQHHRPVRTVAETRPEDGTTGRTSPQIQINGLTICLAIILAAMALNMFIASIVLSNGYISTCLQYVHRVKSYLMVSGNMVELITNRMSCGTIYDFMDYLQPPSRQVTYELIHRHKTNPRDSVINTSALLIISIVLSWLNTFIWIVFTFCTYYFR
ncbi:uncharacterized protein LOC132937035 isoform X1 [Metopolophium dirhodum]|uniref:uncharacterized protein LOC132937035 isoform X1 n=1 Tax=Metopolophium dirhodum TaxID=44670 RepID=UPI0029903FC0|nr:uncharacterized protein LOC132937035 isoform X1 [Metopolophium dirhodum]XP_060859847.1 uncharacterized protein LOC132937035 isoform X1 [Metopolophium dirhodum]XP_060859848.1 uncharacterized protein LOC132937035 isoform X1 [Metopolophium dirhodum]